MQSKGLRSSKQLADLQETRTGLLRLIQNWREVQIAYIPHVASLVSQIQPTTDVDVNGDNLPPETFAENISLFLPLSLPLHIRSLPEGLSSRIYVSWNDASVKHKRMTPLPKFDVSDVLFKGFGSLRD